MSGAPWMRSDPPTVGLIRSALGRISVGLSRETGDRMLSSKARQPNGFAGRALNSSKAIYADVSSV